MEKRREHHKKCIWFRLTIVIFLVMVLSAAIINYIVDPYFHYHKPITKYRLYNERYINDGIARHFDYDAVIIGNSLVENFKTSQYDSLYGTNSVKLPYSGAGIKECWIALGRIIGRQPVLVDIDYPIMEYGFSDKDINIDQYGCESGYNDGVRKVLVSMDIEDAMLPFYWSRYREYPEYLYDKDSINDINYLLNKDTLYRGTLYDIMMFALNKDSTTFDEYSTWERVTGEDIVLPMLKRYGMVEPKERWKFEGFEKEKLRDNLRYNVIPVIEANPDVEFMILLPPKSIAKWAEYYIYGGVEFRIDGLEYMLSVLTEYDNVRIFGFDDEVELTTDLDRYSDFIHYDASINEWMLSEMAMEHHLITKESYMDYISKLRDFYYGYEYTSLNDKIWN